jgi:putative SOS response-associated peptidase YedK
MCGRYVSVSTPEQLAEAFGIDEIRTESKGERYNVAPTLDVYSVIEHDGQRRLGTLRWGFLPHWAKSLKDRAPINVRVETIHEKRMFRSAFEKRRCILPADGFYEWQEREGHSRKQPWFIHDPDDRPLAFAGIWTVWRGPEADDDTEPVYSCAIVTTDAQGRMADLHDRMPVMLPERLWAEWLSAEPREATHLQDVIASLGAPRLEAYRIGDRVNNVRNDGPELVEPGEVE